MPSIDNTKFVINSDYPIPAQMKSIVGNIFIPAGLSTSDPHTYTVNVTAKEGTQIFRQQFKSSRDGKVYLVPSGLDLTLYYDDVKLHIWTRIASDNVVRCIVNTGPGSDINKSQVEHDINVDFYISCFRVP